jgi:pilus assembly protein CpaB
LIRKVSLSREEVIMSLRSIVALFLALVFGGSAAVGVSTYVNNRAPAATSPDLAKVVVAAVDVPRGTVIMSDQVKLRDVPKDQVHARAITKLEDAVNRAVITPLIKDEPILDGRLSPKGSRGSMAWVTKPGMRAFTIQTTTLSAGVAGFVMPGDHVDVLMTMTGEANDGAGGGSTTTLLQNVEVMAVDQAIEAPAANKVDLSQLRSVTLQVTPNEALVLDLGQNKGMLHLSLRNPEDLKTASTRPATLTDLRFRQAKPWDERVKGVLEAFGKALEKRQQEKPAPEVKLAPVPEPLVYIRTIRGVQEGAVPVMRVEEAGDGALSGRARNGPR